MSMCRIHEELERIIQLPLEVLLLLYYYFIACVVEEEVCNLQLNIGEEQGFGKTLGLTPGHFERFNRINGNYFETLA